MLYDVIIILVWPESMQLPNHMYMPQDDKLVYRGSVAYSTGICWVGDSDWVGFEEDMARVV